MVEFSGSFIIKLLVCVEDDNGFGIGFSIGMSYVVIKVVSIVSDDDSFIYDSYVLYGVRYLIKNFFLEGVDSVIFWWGSRIFVRNFGGVFRDVDGVFVILIMVVVCDINFFFMNNVFFVGGIRDFVDVGGGEVMSCFVFRK